MNRCCCAIFLLALAVLAYWFFVLEHYEESELEIIGHDLIASGAWRLSELKKKLARVKVTQRRVDVGALNVFYREASLGETARRRCAVVLLHGIAANEDGSSAVWLQRSTMQVLAAAGHRVIAPDLPGTLYSQTSRQRLAESDKGRFLELLLDALSLERAVVVGASWGGTFSVPLLIHRPNLFAAFVAVAPVGTRQFSPAQYSAIEVPTLIIHGEKDYALGEASYADLKHLPAHKYVRVPAAGHAVFQEQPDAFHAACLAFLDHIAC